MMQLTALQHLFTSVEKERSPTGRRGYQTLFYSQEGLSEDDLRILETRSQYYSTPGDPVKRQFYWLPGDRWVVSESVALAERDEFGRKGRYLTHSLIFPASSWLQLECAPFGVWSAKPFIGRLDQAFGQGDMETGTIPPLTLQVRSEWQDGALAAAGVWTPENLLELAHLAWHASALQSAGQHIALSGEATDVGRVLLASYLLTATDERRYLTFDTHSVGCNWGSQDHFWAQGFPPGERIRTSMVVDAAARRVQTDALPSSPSRPYTRWMEEIVIPGRLDSLLAWQDWALALDGVIQGEPADPSVVASVDPQFARHFAQLSADDLRNRMQGALPADLPSRLVQPVLGQLGRSPYDQLRQLMRGLSEGDVVDLVYEALLAEAAPLSSAEQKALAPLAETHAGIRGLLYLWSGNLVDWRKELDTLTAQEYEQVVARLLRGRAVPSWKMISPKQIDDWFYHGIPYTDSKEMVEVARALGECGGPSAVDRLAPYVPQLQPAEQKRLYKWLKKTYHGQASETSQALELALGKAGSPERGLKGLLSRSRKK